MKNGGVKLMAVFEEALNEFCGEKVIVLKDIMTLDGIYVQHYMLIKNLDAFMQMQYLCSGDKVVFTGNYYKNSNYGVLLPRDFTLAS